MDDIALFVEVARQRSFTRAGETLGIPNSTLSRRMTALERHLGVRLLSRTTREIRLTEAGQRYFERCRAILSDLDMAHAGLSEMAEQPSGQLRLSMPVEFGLNYMLPLIDEFARRYPAISFVLDLSPRHVELDREHIDLALRLGPVNDPQLVARKLGDMERLLFASPLYLARHGEPERPEQLPEHDCIRLPSEMMGATWRLESGSEVVEVRVKGRFTTNNVTMMGSLAQNGHGIAALALALARPALEQGLLQRVLPDWHLPRIPVYAVVASRVLPAKTRLLIEFLAARLQV
ncbi:LysR family transcriptional regulator [Chitinimonas lacunae]|uniref:LysR family transcriptional regulator n=1 Tax=Chitinimonas lacunae TaxID=1963018 RepID=A0ABV8MWS9_9NEIS